MQNPKTTFKNLNWEMDGRLFGFGTSPQADWKIIFISTSILAILNLALNVYIFIQIDKGEIFMVEQATGESEKILDIDTLKETILYYQNKALEFERIKSAVTPSVDPSL